MDFNTLSLPEQESVLDEIRRAHKWLDEIGVPRSSKGDENMTVSGRLAWLCGFLEVVHQTPKEVLKVGES